MTSLFRTQSPTLRDYGWLGLFAASYLAAIGFVFLSDADLGPAPKLAATIVQTSP